MINEEKIHEIANKVSQSESAREAAENYGQALDSLKTAGVSFNLINELDMAVSDRLIASEELAYQIGVEDELIHCIMNGLK